MNAATREPFVGVSMACAGARIRRVGVALAVVVVMLAAPVGMQATTAGAAVPKKCCVLLPPVTLTLFPTSGPQFSPVQNYGNCGIGPPPNPGVLYGLTELQNFVVGPGPLPPPPPNAQIVASWSGHAADDGSYNDDLTWDPMPQVIPGTWYFGFTWCAQWSSDDPNTAQLLFQKGPSAPAWFCVTGPNVATCPVKFAGVGLELAAGLGTASAYVQGWLRVPSPPGAQGSSSAPPTQPPAPPTTRPRPATSSTTSTTTSTTTTTTPLRRVPR